MSKKPHTAFSPSRRATLFKTGAVLATSMLPFGLPSAQPVIPTPYFRAFRRYNASASKAGERMLKSYAKAVRAMLALPPEDPRNWYRHAIVHTLDCPHGNWWFLPWHRGYLGWFEQICRELSGDPRFALPYWDWTAEPKIPDGMFYDVLDPNHEAYIPTAADFDNRLRTAIANSGYWTSPGGTFTRRSQYGQLLARGVRFEQDLMFDIITDPSGRLFYEQPGARGLRRERPQLNAATGDSVSIATIRAALDAPDFPTFASPKSSNHGTPAGFGILEAKPHNSVHRCVGSRDCNFVEGQGFMADMLSPVDPVFFLHHANMDRLWDVWERKQKRLGLPTLPAGVELRTDLPDNQKSPEEKATDYYRWAREPMLFFVDKNGAPVTKTEAGDYASVAAFNYDYEPGSGEDSVPRTTSQPRARSAGRRVFPGTVQTRQVHGEQPASATVAVPAATLASAAASGVTLVANITLNFAGMAHDPYVVVLNGPDDLSNIDATSPFYLATIVMFGHHANCGALTYALPLGEKLASSGTSGPRSDGTLRVRVVPLHTAMGHHGMGEASAVELLAVNVEAY
ncbi:tyrosinase family protein [Massilia sp. Dwa41.01b]|uniref:tyrosinase family protein n=1 Tax=unclassified Massilia TaxID=2609279 RepID=UPI0016019137|nr:MULTISPECIES: tyrosinase family protein [unclassified Massilia]QNA87625.1 tyrosinase family protein [Massilia sp. Dwa41.01b]QNA98529.1 tyrosinase family protein [Massilia sp. Se16.2.3]